ncbi:MAG: ABC transporter substrate-binding protein [Peptostreptococcaceae bacterium]|nr:ABC transporter substrate-binding protein [Peptostreptococcaceae bacterium]
MKKIIVALLVIFTLLLTSCGSQETASVDVSTLKGPTAMGLVKLMEDSESGAVNENEYTFTISGSIDEVVAKISKGETDLACIPANLASTLYNKTDGNVNVLAINTLGVIYICENGDSIKSIEDLKGKTIIASGKGATPEYSLNYILEANGIDPASDVNIEWKSEHSECAATLIANEGTIAMLPQPFVTTSTMKGENVRIALDLTEEWNKVTDTSTLITGVIIGNKEFVDNNPDAVDRFLESYEESVTYVNDNNDEAAALIGKFDIFPEEVAKVAIPTCNIVCITGDKMKTKLQGYLEELYNQNPEAVGGELPGDEFYYINK